MTGLEHCGGLRSLYLHQNLIREISGMENLSRLVTLNLSHNKIRVIEGLEGCTTLKNLDLGHNAITEYLDIEGMRACPALTSVDISHNYIEYAEGILEYLTSFKNLGCFYFKGNPALRKISKYRKMMTVHLPKLMYLDDRPVFELDRKAADAFREGGALAEKEARTVYHEFKKNQIKNSIKRNVAIENEARDKLT